ncbi:uncharacterized protein LOC131956121 [Physella acuta]|uniref:uncharacterized protein LOC131956121 n=1 Tax=Physella acuta TaxID=109671 RepID=UPI0027DDC766|nr:uncharacterized protein LOC131956121 [Physella acuta]
MDVRKCSTPASGNSSKLRNVSGQQRLADEHQVPASADVNSQTSVPQGAVCAVNTSAGEQNVLQHVMCQDGQWKTADYSTLWEIGRQDSRRQKRRDFGHHGPTGGPHCREICDSGWWKRPCKERTRHTAGPRPGSTLGEGSYKVIYEAKTKTGLVEFCETTFLVKRNASDINIHCTYPDASYTCPNGTKVGANCTSVCNDDDGNTTRTLTITCQKNLTWSNYKMCRACPTSLNIDETHLERIHCSVDRDVGMMLCTVVCEKGYMTGRETYLMCGLMTNFTWSQVTKENPLGVVPACVVSLCGQCSAERVQAGGEDEGKHEE